MTLSDANSDAICLRYRHYPVHIPSLFFSTLIGSFLCIYSDASNLNLYVKEVVYKSLFNDFTPISSSNNDSDRGDFFFSGHVRQPLPLSKSFEIYLSIRRLIDKSRMI